MPGSAGMLGDTVAAHSPGAARTWRVRGDGAIAQPVSLHNTRLPFQIIPEPSQTCVWKSLLGRSSCACNSLGWEARGPSRAPPGP